MAFYDDLKSNPMPISPYTVCRGSLIVRDILKALFNYITKLIEIESTLEKSSHILNEKRAIFNEHWSSCHSENMDFWTIEDIIHRYKIVQGKLENEDLDLLKKHTEISTQHPLLQQILYVACSLLNYSEQDDFHTIITQNPLVFLQSLVDNSLQNAAFQDLIHTKIRPICEISKLVSVVEQKVSRMFVDMVSLLPACINFRIFQYLDSKSITNSACVSTSWNSAIKPDIWKSLAFTRGW